MKKCRSEQQLPPRAPLSPWDGFLQGAHFTFLLNIVLPRLHFCFVWGLGAVEAKGIYLLVFPGFE